ncbi:DMT family transporter [Alphaproteobacteria bacterium]|nr:DMT family transporter [Alphaproteobacteria bacterium]
MSILIFRHIYASAPIMLILATIGWGSNTIAGRLAVGEIYPMMLIFLRWGFVVLLIAAISGRSMIAEWGVINKKLKWVFLMGGCGLSLFNALFYMAAHSTSAINLGIIQSIMPAMILLGSFFLFGSRINKIQMVGVGLTFVGCIVVITKGSIDYLLLLTFSSGDLLMLVACLFYAGYSLGLKNRPDVSGIVMMGYFSIAAFMMTIPLLIIEILIYGLTVPTEKGWGIVLYIAIIPSFLSQIFFMRGVDLVGPGSAGLYANLVPIFSASMAVIILNEAFSIYHLVAMGVVFSGIAVFEYQKQLHAQPVKN